MIANRFFKTTIGVPFQLVIGTVAKVAADFATYRAFNDGAAKGNYMGFSHSGGRLNNGLTWGTALTAAQKKLPVSFAFAQGALNLVNTTPIVGETIKTELVVYKAPTLQDARIVLVSGTPLTTQELCFKVIETTPGASSLPVWDYNAVISTSAANAYAAIVAKVNAAPDGEFFAATAVTGGVQIVSTDANRHFRLAMTVTPSRIAQYDDTTWTYTQTTPAFAGSGTYAQVLALESEAHVMRGYASAYPQEGVSPAEMGQPISMAEFAGSGVTWDILAITGTRFESSPTPIEVHHNKVYLFIAVPAGQGAAIAATFA